MNAITNALSSLALGVPEVHRNLVVFPLSGIRQADFEYITLDDALASGAAHITEVSHSGSVPQLRFTNHGEVCVFLLDGEELVGAKQNRVLNLSIMVAAKSTVTIPVSCVEAHRWSYSSDHFSSSKHAHFSRGRATKAASVTTSLGMSGSRTSDQGRVWDEIRTKYERLGVDSPTEAMNDVYRSRGTDIEGFVEALPPMMGQAGAVYCIGNRIAGLDVFDRPKTFAALAPKLVRSYALDAIEERSEAAMPPRLDAIDAFLAKASMSPIQEHAAVGLGQDARFTGGSLSGGALSVDDSVIHLCAFPAAAIEVEHISRQSRMTRAARRRQG